MEKKEELEKRRKVVPHAVRRQQKRDRTRERAEENGEGRREIQQCAVKQRIDSAAKQRIGGGRREGTPCIKCTSFSPGRETEERKERKGGVGMRACPFEWRRERRIFIG